MNESATPISLADLQAEFENLADSLFQNNAQKINNTERQLSTAGGVIQTEVLYLDTDDVSCDVILERTRENTPVPPDYDIDTMMVVNDVESGMSLIYYLHNDGVVDLEVLYHRLKNDGNSMKVYDGVCDALSLNGAIAKLERAEVLSQLPHANLDQ